MEEKGVPKKEELKVKKEIEKSEDKEKKQINKEKSEKEKRKIIVPIKPIIYLIIVLVIIAVIFNKKGDIKINVKNTLSKIVEKSDLETVNITYNVIAKKCKDEKDCDLNSNNINDFRYVVSCKGTITAGINFNEVMIDIDKKNKKLIVIMPEATLTSEPSIGSINYLNGTNLSSDEHPNALKLCQETIKNKSNADDKLIPAAKEQARTLLEGFYKQWIKAYDSSYGVEVR